MDNNLINEYLEIFESEANLSDVVLENFIFIDLSKKSSIKEDDFRDGIIKSVENIDKEYIGALIFYGYRMGALQLKNKTEFITRQYGYKDTAILPFNIDEFLNKDTSKDNELVSISNIIEWIINPESNIDIVDSIIRKMVFPITNDLCKRTQMGKDIECEIFLPPMSKNIEVYDWENIFRNLQVDNINIKILGYGDLFKIDKIERLFIVQSHTDGESEYLIISAYENIRGHNRLMHSMAFDTVSGKKYLLHDIKDVSFSLDNSYESYSKDEHKQEILSHWDYIPCKYPVIRGISSFLGMNTATFIRKIYKIKDVIKPYSDEDKADLKEKEHIESIKKVFKEGEALQILDICSRLLKEENIYNISLGDMVYVANLIEKSDQFVDVGLITKNKYELGTYRKFGKYLDLDRLGEIPSNYASISWEISNSKMKLIPYYKLDEKKDDINDIILSVVDFYDHCTADIVADELLYMFSKGEEPSAYFTAKVFMYLSSLGDIEIESKNEYVDKIVNVDNVQYKELDKTKIKPAKLESKNNSVVRIKRRTESSIFRSKNNARLLSNTLIDELGLSVRSYNCLKRVHINYISDIIKLTPTELLGVRNLGKMCTLEVIRAVNKLGYKLKNQR